MHWKGSWEDRGEFKEKEEVCGRVLNLERFISGLKRNILDSICALGFI